MTTLYRYLNSNWLCEFRLRKGRLYWEHRGQSVIFLSSVVVIAVALLTLFPSVIRTTQTALGHTGTLGRINRHLNPFRSRQTLLSCGLPVYDLKIARPECAEVMQTVEEAKRRGILGDDLKKWSKAKFIHDGVVYDVKVRIRGDTPVHWANSRKSWRVRFDREAPLDGRREINLIVTEDGKGLFERFTNALFRRLGMMTLRDQFVVLRINGILQGVYYEVEHFDAPFLVHERRPETSIFANPRGGEELGSFKDHILDREDQAAQALEVLLEYERHPTPDQYKRAKAVTDMSDYVRWLTGTTLLCSDHTRFIGDNHKTYYDTSRGLFSRIPWDLESQRIPRLQRFESETTFGTFDVFARWPMSQFRRATLLSDRYRLERNRLLWDMVKDDRVLRLFDKTYEECQLPLWADVQAGGDEPARLAAFRDNLASNIRHIRGALESNLCELRIRRDGPDLASLEFAVNNASGIELRGIAIKDAGLHGHVSLIRDDNRDGVRSESDFVIGMSDSKERDTVVKNIREILEPEMGINERYAAYLYEGGDVTYRTKPLQTVIYPKTRRYTYFVVADGGVPFDPANLKPQLFNAVTGEAICEPDLQIRYYQADHDFDPLLRTRSAEEFLADHTEFQQSDDDRSTLVLPAGEHRFDGITVVPGGVTLIVEAGARLRMGNEASIVAFGPITVVGTEDEPIVIEPSGGARWGSIASIRPGGRCIFRHVQVRGGGGATAQGITLTGAIAVHDGDAEIEDCRFFENPSEDALNIKYGTVNIRRSIFEGNDSDGVDLDFVAGSVSGCHFIDNRGDGLDLSGSTLTVRSCLFDRSGDKGLSVGEQSDVSVADCLFDRCTIGAASKDLSVASFAACTFLDNATAVAAYRKKPIFGGGQARLVECTLAGGDDILRIDEFSSIQTHGCQATHDEDCPDCIPLSDERIRSLRQNRADPAPDPLQTVEAANDLSASIRVP